jgi:hypothetical protein
VKAGRVRRAVALTAAAAALVLAAGTGSAQAAPTAGSVPGSAAVSAAAHTRAPALDPGQVGSIRISEVGLPSTVRIGQTVSVNVWFEQNSRDLFEIGGYGTGVWSPYYPNGKGLTVSYLSPVTNRWENSPEGADGSFDFAPERAVYVRPNTWAVIKLRITFTSRARLGAWYLSPGGFSYSLVKTVGGAELPGSLAFPFGPWPGYRFTVQR